VIFPKVTAAQNGPNYAEKPNRVRATWPKGLRPDAVTAERQIFTILTGQY